MAVFKNKTILRILDYYKTLWAISATSAVSHWDLETYMPAGAAVPRGEALAKLSTLRQKLFLDQGFVALINKAEKEKNLSDEERAVVRVMVRALKSYEKLPPDFLEEFERLTNQATVVWREAKIKNNYKLFEPYLGKVFEMNRRAADYLGYKDSPYDALLDQYEEDLTSSYVSSYFDKIRNPLIELTDNIVNSKNFFKKHSLETAKYDREKIQNLNDKILKLFFDGYGKYLRLDVSSHPFTTSFSKFDTRITTWYHPQDFGRSLMATVHEFGHALYDLQCRTELEMTPIQGGSSLVIHESQSRFWENFVGRSTEFVNYIYKDVREALNNKKLTASEVYLYFNKVMPSLNRVESDEVTYHFHIMLRFEIEKALIEGTEKFKNVREIWNSKMQEYLKMSPKTDTEGVLQDIHWSGGTVGYFPTYSLGTSLGAQWEEKIGLKPTPENLPKIKKWLENHIHKYGTTYTLPELLSKNKMEFDPMLNIKYLTDKYSKIYGF